MVSVKQASFFRTHHAYFSTKQCIDYVETVLYVKCIIRNNADWHIHTNARI